MEADYLVALSYSTSPEGRLLTISWCAYHLSLKTSTEESSLFIVPSGENLEDLFNNHDLTEMTGLTIQDFNSAPDLPSAMQSLNKAFYESIILNNATFTILTYKDALLCSILPDECLKMGLKLAPHFHKYFDVCSEFEKRYPESGSNLTLSKMLQTLGMIEIPERIKAQEDCKTMVRLISRLIKDGHSFSIPKDVNTEKSKPKILVSKPIKKQTSILEIPVPSRVVIIRGIKSSTEIYEIEEFFYGLRIEKIVLVVDPYSEKTEICIVKFLTEEDALEAVLYDKRRLKKRLVSVEESNEELFQMMVQNSKVEFKGEKLFYLKSREKTLNGLTPSKFYLGMTYFFAENYYFVIEDKSENSSLQSVRVDEQELMGYLRIGHSPSQLVLNSEQSSRAVKIRGFLHSVTKAEVAEFLKDFEVFRFNVFIRRGAKDKTGVEVIVVMNTVDERERVCRVLSNRLYKNRLIEIYFYS